MLLSRVLFSVWVSPPVPHGFLAGRMISELSRQKACSVSNEQVRETSHPARGELLQRKGKKGSAKAGVTNPLLGYLQRGRDFGRGPRTLGPCTGVYCSKEK